MFFDLIFYVMTMVGSGAVVMFFLSDKKIPLLETLFMVWVCGFFMPVFLFYLLAAFKVYSFATYVSCWGGILFVLLSVALRKGKHVLIKEVIVNFSFENKWPAVFVYSVALLLFLLWFGHPSEWLVSYGIDAGNYVIQAGYQTTHTSLYLEDYLVETYKNYFPEGNYKINSTTGFFPTFPFPPLNKLFLAVAINFNLKIASWVHLFLAITTYFSIIVISRTSFKNEILKLTTPIFALFCPVYVFYSTIPMSEMLMLAVILTSLALSLVSWRYQVVFPSVLGAILFASIFSIRLEAASYYFPCVLFCMLVYVGDFDKNLTKLSKWILISLAIFVPIFWYPGVGSGIRYYSAHLNSLFSFQNIAIPIVAFGSLLLIALSGHLKWLKIWVRALAESKLLGYLLGGTIIAILFLQVYLRFILSHDLAIDFGRDSELLRRMMHVNDMQVLMQNTTSIFVFMGVLGCGLIFITRTYRFYPIVFLFAGISIVLLFNPRHSNDNYWMVRRYLPTVFPLFILCSPFVIDWILNFAREKKKVYIIIAMAWVFVNSYLLFNNNRQLESHSLRSYVGITDVLLKHAEHFEPTRDIILVEGSIYKSDGYSLAMKYLFGINAVNPFFDTITDEQLKHFVHEKTLEGKYIYFSGLDEKLFDRLNRTFILEDWDKGFVPIMKQETLYKITLLKNELRNEQE